MSDAAHSLRQPLAVDAGLGQLAREPDHADHVEQMIRAVLLTSPGERPGRPDFGCGIRRMLFAPNSEATAHLLQVSVFSALDKWLGSVLRTDEVKVEPQGERLVVTVVYTLAVTRERRYLNLEVTL